MFNVVKLTSAVHFSYLSSLDTNNSSVPVLYPRHPYQSCIHAWCKKALSINTTTFYMVYLLFSVWFIFYMVYLSFSVWFIFFMVYLSFSVWFIFYMVYLSISVRFIFFMVYLSFSVWFIFFMVYLSFSVWFIFFPIKTNSL